MNLLRDNWIKRILNSLLWRSGYRMLPINTPLTNAFKAQKYLMHPSRPITVFDVGAHIGQTSLHYNKIFKKPSIYSFEPFLPTFELLKNSVKKFDNIKVFNTALSNSSGQVDFHVNKLSATNSILPISKDVEKNWDENVYETIDSIKINSMTLDDFVEKFKIETIDILKIDTQGTEYEIIEGASRSLEQNMIKIIYLEIILVPTYQEQKHFDEILLLLREKGFQLFNLYNYTYSGSHKLIQIDAIFINKDFEILGSN